ncbi:MAG: hypothetical protein KC609_11395 [Myxococcales bacterium]|nr:hypothetical protein [Myxococcales bacterium]
MTQRIATFAVGVAAMLLMLIVMMMMLVALGCAQSEHFICPDGREIGKTERCTPKALETPRRDDQTRQRLETTRERAPSREGATTRSTTGDRAPETHPKLLQF